MEPFSFVVPRAQTERRGKETSDHLFTDKPNRTLRGQGKERPFVRRRGGSPDKSPLASARDLHNEYALANENLS
jgi:hypothetical protein